MVVKTLYDIFLESNGNIRLEAGKRRWFGTALMAAFVQNHVGIAKLLLQHGADPESVGYLAGVTWRGGSWDGLYTPRSCAVREQHTEMLELLSLHEAEKTV